MGNFWSATYDHINHLEPLTSEYISKLRPLLAYTAAEMWIANSEWKGNPAKLTLNRGRRFYVELIRPEEYQNKTSDSTLNWMGLSLD